MNSHPVKDILSSRESGRTVGVYSACTASELAIEACIDRAMLNGDMVLIEATANQVNQYGGYTGMAPADYARFVLGIAGRRGLPHERVILGGDHLGPLPWASMGAERAMPEANKLVRRFVHAGFTKIHIDTSMRLADDDGKQALDTALIARRAVELIRSAETAHAEAIAAGDSLLAPVYVIGSEVPIPGGAQDAETMKVTDPSDFVDTVEYFKNEFSRAGLEGVWERVIAVVVQPGVEFGDEEVHEYDRIAASALTSSLADYPGLVFEGHSTDYQQAKKLREMVEDGMAILKVGPALTFALREGFLALECMEKELLNDRRVELSKYSEILERQMTDNPEHWIKHYRGDEESLRFKRRFSYSDRSRYYLPAQPVRAAAEKLMLNLSMVNIPDTLISQYMPLQYVRVRSGQLSKEGRSLVKDRVGDTVDGYLYATGTVPSA